jgi:hypothetical protein
MESNEQINQSKHQQKSKQSSQLDLSYEQTVDGKFVSFLLFVLLFVIFFVFDTEHELDFKPKFQDSLKSKQHVATQDKFHTTYDKSHTAHLHDIDNIHSQISTPLGSNPNPKKENNNNHYSVNKSFQNTTTTTTTTTAFQSNKSNKEMEGTLTKNDSKKENDKIISMEEIKKQFQHLKGEPNLRTIAFPSLSTSFYIVPPIVAVPIACEVFFFFFLDCRKKHKKIYTVFFFRAGNKKISGGTLKRQKYEIISC